MCLPRGVILKWAMGTAWEQRRAGFECLLMPTCNLITWFILDKGLTGLG